MINFKQQDLIEELMTEISKRFPEVHFIRAIESPEDPESLWIEVTSPEDEDRQIDLVEFAGDKLTDIHMDYGYHMLMIPTRRAAA